jgi:hypothetical protein
MISEKDKFYEIKSKDYVVDLKNVLLFEPDTTINFLEKQNLDWNRLFDSDNNYMIAISSSESDMNLEKNQGQLLIYVRRYQNIC